VTGRMGQRPHEMQVYEDDRTKRSAHTDDR
jgi:hypothetical protein